MRTLHGSRAERRDAVVGALDGVIEHLTRRSGPFWHTESERRVTQFHGIVGVLLRNSTCKYTMRSVSAHSRAYASE